MGHTRTVDWPGRNDGQESSVDKGDSFFLFPAPVISRWMLFFGAVAVPMFFMVSRIEGVALFEELTSWLSCTIKSGALVAAEVPDLLIVLPALLNPEICFPQDFLAINWVIYSFPRLLRHCFDDNLLIFPSIQQ